MKTIWINTNDYYHALTKIPDINRRTEAYQAQFIEPWQRMMQMLGPMFGADSGDDLAVARAWGWLLPADLEEVPAVLSQLEAANAWQVADDALVNGAARFAPYQSQIGLDTIVGWLILADANRVDPIGRGYTGAIDWTQPQIIAQFDTPNAYNIPRIPGLVVHELHHLVRLRLFPWDMHSTSVADYIIHEGLAESFAAALYGEDIVGYYVTDISPADLEIAKNLMRDGLGKTGFDIIRSYIFGDDWAEKFKLKKVGGMPAYGGYAIGYHVVQAYLKRTGKTIEEATLVPATEIVAASGYFN